jgi:neutral ceramidase
MSCMSMNLGRTVMRMLLTSSMVALSWAAVPPVSRADWKAGAASAVITPAAPVRMGGYASRTTPFTAVEADLFARALVLEDGTGQRAVLITADLLGIRADLADRMAAGIEQALGIDRARVLVSASHTHAGPILSLDRTPADAGTSPEDAAATAAYTQDLVGTIVSLAVRAAGQVEPARLYWGTGIADFAMNRREFTPKGVILGVNPRGPVDRSVPVLRVDDAQGRPRVAVFSYACHNTTMTGDNHSIAGDYAGFAQAHLQAQMPGVQAMFMAGTGADANPHPRGTVDLARRHGATLGAEVARVLQAEMREITGPLQVAFDRVDLPLQPQTRATLLEVVANGPAVHRATAQRLLAKLDAGEAPPRSYAAPVAVWQFGRDLTLVALSGEVVVDYAYALDRALGPLSLWTVAYANDYFGYLPSPRVLEEGGYETRGLFSGDGWFTADSSAVLIEKVRELAGRVGRSMPPAGAGR